MSSMIDCLKELGNKEFRRKAYRAAIQLYTEALYSVDASTPIETQRILLANRAQAFVFNGHVHETLRDLNHALSPQYTTQISPKPLTAKCRYRRAKLLCVMAKYDEAQADYGEFANIMEGLGANLSGEELSLKSDLDSRAAAADDSEQRRKDDLIRAVDAQGIMVWRSYRDTFPLPPPNMHEPLDPDFDPGSMTICFDTVDSRPDRNLPDPNLTPISIPVTVRAPCFHYPDPDNRTSCSTRQQRPGSGGETIGSFIDGVFMDMANSSQTPVEKKTQILAMATEHENDGVVFTMSSHGRLFKLPRETTIKDIVAGARWPRQPNAPVFEDLRQSPRKRADEIDGIKLSMGWMVEVFVIPTDKLGVFLGDLERGFAEAGM